MSIKIKLVAAFLVFTLVPMVLFGALILHNAKGQMKAVRLAQLDNVADLKKNKIETFFEERTGDIKSARSLEVVRRYLPLLSSLSRDRTDPRYKKESAELDRQVAAFREGYGYLDVMLADKGGNVVYASNPSHAAALGRRLPNLTAFEEGKKGVYFTDVFQNKEDGNRFEIFATAPVQDFKGVFAGEVVIEIDMDPIYKFIQDSTGLGKTGEALIVKKEGDSVSFLSPLRRDPQAALKKKAPFGEQGALAAQMAARGKSGSGITLDYASVEVLAAWRYIPSLRWGLVTKIDAGEAFIEVTRLRNIAMLIGAVLVIIVVTTAIFVARSLSAPLLELQRGAEIIGGGDLTFRVGTDAKDEIGRLSRAFDRMTKSLSVINAELNQKAVALEAANKELESFSYSVSHDLRAPLRHISGFLELLQSEPGVNADENGRRYMSVIARSAKRMGLLIDDLLAFSRIGRSELKLRTVNTERLVKEVISEFEPETKGRDITWNIGMLPQVCADPSLLRLVLVNLISNAVKFTNTRQKALIEIDCAPHEEECVFLIRDNGVGFDMSYKEKLFGVFHRLHRQEEFEGTGIGLANVRRIISRHGGRTWAEGAVDKGATFYFTLPVIKET